MNKILLFIYSILISFSAGIIGSFFTISQVDSWYSTLIKPEFSPPNWVFAPVWNILYFLMGISLFLVLISKRSRDRSLGIKLFYAQLILNALWSIVFFGMENIALGFIVILVLWGMIFMTIKTFLKINTTAGSLLLPYIVWVTIATLLNLGIVILN
jgi:tryptophan-rich sensory protein